MIERTLIYDLISFSMTLSRSESQLKLFKVSCIIKIQFFTQIKVITSIETWKRHTISLIDYDIPFTTEIDKSLLSSLRVITPIIREHFHWNPSDSKSPQLFRSLSILIWTISILPRIYNSFLRFGATSMIGITVNFYSSQHFFYYLAGSRYFSSLSLSLTDLLEVRSRRVDTFVSSRLLLLGHVFL